MTTATTSKPAALKNVGTVKAENNTTKSAATTEVLGSRYTLRKRKAAMTNTTTTTVRPLKKRATVSSITGGKNTTTTSTISRSRLVKQTFVAKDTDVLTVKSYPKLQHERMKYINPKTLKKVTPFQFKVYDLVAQIPAGQVTSYKVVSDLLKSSPRAVGQALKLNPFCPLPVPCHRVIAADHSIGGFAGGSGDHQNTADKKAKLQAEGCIFGAHYDFKHDKNGTRNFFDQFVL